MATSIPPSRTAARPNKQRHLRYTSPRCELEDDEVLPSLEDHDERWKHIQQQAGPHQQDGSVLDFTSRQTLTPQTLKVGVPPQVASRVRELHVNCNEHSHSLPEWLDVVCSLFFQLQHFYTNHEESERIPTQEARMRRLYILYRLPDLVSIDGKNVTLVERQLARPSSPNGHRVKREDWIVSNADDDDSTVSSEDDSSILQNHGDAVEVSLFGVVKRVSADPPKEEWNEPELPEPYEAPQKSSEVTTSVTKSVERAHRTMNKPSQQSKEQVVKTPTSSSSSACGGLAAAFADGNPCVGSRRSTSLDEPHTLDYPTTDVTPPRKTDRYAVPDDGRGDNKRKARGSRSQSLAVPLHTQHQHGSESIKKNKQEANDAISPEKARGSRSQKLTVPLHHNKHQQESESIEKKKEADATTTPERLTEQRPTTPETKTSPSASLSSPFPMQFRSKSFNGTLPSRTRGNNGGLPRKMSSPDLSPEKISRGKGTIDSPAFPSSPKGIVSFKSRQYMQQRAERPPPCPPGSSRRVAPAASTPTRRGWRSKNSIRSTSIVDDDDDEDYISDDEDVIEHE